MPPAMALQQDSPGKTYGPAKLANFIAKGIVEIPDAKSSDKDRKASTQYQCQYTPSASILIFLESNSPVATMTHIVFNNCRDFSVPRVSRAGRNWDSITHMLRNTTVAVNVA